MAASNLIPSRRPADDDGTTCCRSATTFPRRPPPPVASCRSATELPETPLAPLSRSRRVGRPRETADDLPLRHPRREFIAELLGRRGLRVPPTHRHAAAGRAPEFLDELPPSSATAALLRGGRSRRPETPGRARPPPGGTPVEQPRTRSTTAATTSGRSARRPIYAGEPALRAAPSTDDGDLIALPTARPSSSLVDAHRRGRLHRHRAAPQLTRRRPPARPAAACCIASPAAAPARHRPSPALIGR